LLSTQRWVELGRPLPHHTTHAAAACRVQPLTTVRAQPHNHDALKGHAWVGTHVPEAARPNASRIATTGRQCPPVPPPQVRRAELARRIAEGEDFAEAEHLDKLDASNQGLESVPPDLVRSADARKRLNRLLSLSFARVSAGVQCVGPMFWSNAGPMQAPTPPPPHPGVGSLGSTSAVTPPPPPLGAQSPASRDPRPLAPCHPATCSVGASHDCNAVA
jgi:hypothetical protein